MINFKDFGFEIENADYTEEFRKLRSTRPLIINFDKR